MKSTYTSISDYTMDPTIDKKRPKTNNISLKRIKDVECAMEKVIDMVEEQRTTIDRLDAIVMVLKATLNTMQARLDKLDGVPTELQSVKNTVLMMENSTRRMRNDLDIVSHDSGASHDVYDHNQAILDDWNAEMDAGIIDAPLSRVDLDDRTSAYNSRRTNFGMHEVNGGY